MKQRRLLLRACEIKMQKIIHTGFKGGSRYSGSSDPVPIAGDLGGVPGSSDPVLIAGDCCGVPGSSDPVSTAACRGDGSHCDDAGCERMISIRKPSTSTFIPELIRPACEVV